MLIRIEALYTAITPKKAITDTSLAVRPRPGTKIFLIVVIKASNTIAQQYALDKQISS